MTLTTVLSDQESTLDLLAAMIERNKLYVSTFGYPSGTTCPHCGKQNFSSISNLEQLAAAPPGTQMAHEYCVEIASLKKKVADLEAQPKLTLVQLPNPTGQVGDPSNPDQDQEPTPEPAPAPEPTNPEPRVGQGGCPC